MRFNSLFSSHMKTSFLLLTMALCVPLLPGCGTTGGIGVADFLESPTNAKILAVASQAGAASILASTGNKLSPDMQSALTAAAAPVLNTAGTGIVWAIGEALRGKQGTSAAASAPGLASAITTNAGAPASVASPVAKAVTTLVNSGIPPNAANEAVAVVVQSVAASRDGSAP